MSHNALGVRPSPPLSRVGGVSDAHHPDPDALDGFPRRYAETARFSHGSPRTVSVVDGGRGVLFCRSQGPTDPVQCLWHLDVASGAERLLVDPRRLDADDDQLPPAERARRERAREAASGVVAYSTDRSGSTVALALGGAVFVVDTASGAVTSLTTETAFDPRLDPTGANVAYVSGSDLRLVAVDAADGDRVVRSDGDPLVSHGRAEFVAAEEMGRSRGFWWAPDGRSLLACRVDENPVAEWWIADPAHPDRSPTAVRYPAAGTANAVVGLELIELADTGPDQIRSIDWSDGGRFEYLVDVVWTDGHPPLVVRQTRDQRQLSIATIDPATTAVTERQVVTDEIWVEPHPGTPRWSTAGLVTIVDDGPARRLVVDGTPLTTDGLQIRSLVAVVDAEPAEALVTAWTDPTEIHLAAVELATGRHRLLTTSPGVHGAVADGSTVVVTTATDAVPGTTTAVFDLPATGPLGSPRVTIGGRSADPGFRAEPTWTTLGPNQLPAAVLLPSTHDGQAPLPVVLDPYGGPHAQRALRNHNAHLVSRWLAEQGYAVIVADGRGTPGRGPDWERAVWGDLATPVLDDQVAALDAALDRYPFLDGQRVGIRGWSFGGYLAALAVLRRPDRFAAAVAGAPVTRWGLYDTHYTERYLGHPDHHPDHYDVSDLWTDGEGGPELAPLQRPLLLVHGLADDNVVAAHTLRFSTALLATGSPHRVLPLSGVTHMTPQVAVAENLLRLQVAFFDEVLAP